MGLARTTIAGVLVVAAAMLWPAVARAQSGSSLAAAGPDISQARVSAPRIKDLVRVRGADENPLKGFGLVVGLNGTGDSAKSLSRNALATALLRMDDYHVSSQDIQSKNVAAVFITADLPAFQEAGTRIDVTLSSIGDAKSLQGGVLLVAPLRGPRPKVEDPTVYALAQGQVFIGGSTPTVGMVQGGALVVKSIRHRFVYRYGSVANERISPFEEGDPYVMLLLRRPDFNVADQIAAEINTFVVSQSNALGAPAQARDTLAIALNGGQVPVRIPDIYRDDPIRFLSNVVFDRVLPMGGPLEPPARVVINERSRTYGITGWVTVTPAIVKRAGGTSALIVDGLPDPTSKAPNGANKLVALKDIVELMERGGVRADDIIDYLKTLHRLGALNGEFVVE